MAMMIIKLFFGHSKECEEVQNEKCDEIEVKVPKQIKEHKKKCLFSKEDVLSASTDTRKGYLSPTDSIKMTTQATLNTRSDNIDDVRLALLSIRLLVYIQKNYLVDRSTPNTQNQLRSDTVKIFIHICLFISFE